MLAAAIALRHPPGAAAAVRLLTFTPTTTKYPDPDHGSPSDVTITQQQENATALGMRMRMWHLPRLLEETQEMAHTIAGLVGTREGLPRGSMEQRAAVLAVARAEAREREVWALVEAVVHG